MSGLEVEVLPIFFAAREAGFVQVFGRRNDGLSTHSEGRRPKSAKARNRGLGTAAVPQLWGFRRGLRRRCGGTWRQRGQFCHTACAWIELWTGHGSSL